MARKKNVEPKEDQEQETTIPAEDVADAVPGDDVPGNGFDGPEYAGDVGMTEGGVGPDFSEGALDSEALPAADFPTDEAAPFENVSEGERVLQEGISPDTAETDESEPTVASDGEDYAALLQEAGSTVPIEGDPLMLSDEEAQDSRVMDNAEPDYQVQAPEESAAIEQSGEQGGTTIPTARRPDPRNERVLTIDAHDEVQTQEDLDDIVWHEIQNAYRTRHILTGRLDSVERTPSGMAAAVVFYKGIKVLIPVKEMMVHTDRIPTGAEYNVWLDQVLRVLNARMDFEFDFIIKGLENSSRSVVGSRKDAMLRKRRTFYLDTDVRGQPMIYTGRVVQARVVAVAEKAIRVEVFGAECSVVARGSSWLWVGNLREKFHVGQRILVQIREISGTDPESLSVKVEDRKVFEPESTDVSLCTPQSKYVGQVMDVRKGVVFIRLNNGVNAVAHSCYDVRMPGKKDVVSFAVTRLDEEKNIAIGIITRIIKQNL